MYKMMYLTGRNGTLINSWSNNVVDLLSRLGLSYLWNIRNVSLSSLNTVIQVRFTFDAYLSCVSNIKHRNSLI